MNISIIQLGKTRDSWLLEAIAEYHKRLRPYQKLEFIELPDTSLNKVASPFCVKQKEAETIMKLLREDDYVVLLDERGTQKTSLEFASFLSSLYTVKRVVFIIGGVYGTDECLSERADLLLGLSRMTFTHQMVRLILIEQLYRAVMINHNKAYHY